jgi:hypothetical protein
MSNAERAIRRERARTEFFRRGYVEDIYGTVDCMASFAESEVDDALLADRKETLRRLRAGNSPCLDRMADELAAEWGME